MEQRNIFSSIANTFWLVLFFQTIERVTFQFTVLNIINDKESVLILKIEELEFAL